MVELVVEKMAYPLNAKWFIINVEKTIITFKNRHNIRQKLVKLHSFSNKMSANKNKCNVCLMSEVTQTKIFHYFTELLDQFACGFFHLIQNKSGIDLQWDF